MTHWTIYVCPECGEWWKDPICPEHGTVAVDCEPVEVVERGPAYEPLPTEPGDTVPTFPFRRRRAA